jgi:uncharacterized protein
MKLLHTIAYVLVIVGGLNWGLVAFNFNLVEKLLGSWPSVVMLVYVLVGLSALLEAVTHKNNCKHCDTPKMNSGMSGQM